MKEFYLVPKLTYDRLFNTTQMNLGGQQTMNTFLNKTKMNLEGQPTLKTLKPPPVLTKTSLNKPVNNRKKKY